MTTVIHFILGVCPLTYDRSYVSLMSGSPKILPQANESIK